MVIDDLPVIIYHKKVPQIHIDHEGKTVHAFNNMYPWFVLNESFNKTIFPDEPWLKVYDDSIKISHDLGYQLSYKFTDSCGTIQGWRAAGQ